MVKNSSKAGGSSAKKDAPETVEDYEKQITESLSDLHHKIQQSHKKKEKVDETLHSIEALYDKIRSDNKLSNYHKSKLKTLYTTTLRESEAEAEVLRGCLSEIARIRRLKSDKRVAGRRGHTANADKARTAPIRRGALMVLLQQSANTLPLWIGKLGENPPALCGAIPEENGYTPAAHDAVAALVKGEDGEENWILAEVVSQNSATGKFEVEDVDEEQKERHTLPKKKLIALPTMRANPQTDPDALFPQDAVVLALYPQTTCFYKGVVEQIPVTPTDDYLVAFEDSSYPTGYSPPLPVPQRFVVTFKEANTAGK